MNEEDDYWEATSKWIEATQLRYQGMDRNDLTQVFMRGPFAGWSERQVATLSDELLKAQEGYPIQAKRLLRSGDAVSVPVRGDKKKNE